MSRPVRQSTTGQGHETRRGLSFAQICLTVVALAALVAVAMVMVGWFRPHNPPAAAFSPQSIAASVANSCSGGVSSEVSSSVSAKLATSLRGLQAGSNLSTSDVGAIITKVTPDSNGLAFYKTYTDCLKEQTAAILAQSGVHIAPPATDAASTEAAQDEAVSEAIGEFNPETPSSRLEQVLGAPIANGPALNDKSITAVRYQYKYQIFLSDYYKGGRRLGVWITTKDFQQGKYMIFPQINGVTVSSAIKDCGKLEVDIHLDAATPVCGGSMADNEIFKFFTFFVAGPDDPAPQCTSFLSDHADLDERACPKIAALNAQGYAMSRSEEDLNAVREIAFEDANGGAPFTYRSPEEQKRFEQRGY